MLPLVDNGRGFFSDLGRHGHRLAAVDQGAGASWTYLQLHQLTATFAAALPTDRRCLVMVRATNRIETLIGYLGALGSGHVALLADDRIADQTAQGLAEAFQPDFVWSAQCANTSVGHHNSVFEFGGYHLHASPPTETMRLHPALGAILLTSGTTGSPKGVRLSQANLLANAQAIGDYLELDRTDRAITTLPMGYSYGLSVVNSHLHAGATLLLTEESVARRQFWDFFADQGATSFAGVPLTYELLDAVGFSGFDLPTLRHFTQAGGRMAPERIARYVQEAKRRSVHFFVMYGQTEATARISFLNTTEHPGKSDSIGGPIPGGTMWLRDDAGVPVTERGSVGKLWYAGPNVMLGYTTGHRDLARGDDLSGVLDTGDLAYFDADNHFHIVGRTSRFIKMSGIRIDLDQLEAHLGNRGICCACGGQDDRLRIAVLGEVEPTTVKRALRRAFHLDPELIIVRQVAEIPRTLNGKVNYRQLFGGAWT